MVKDDGLYNGQRTNDGCFNPQIKTPSVPVYPNDVDWKSIDDLMFQLLWFPSQIVMGTRISNLLGKLLAHLMMKNGSIKDILLYPVWFDSL